MENPYVTVKSMVARTAGPEWSCPVRGPDFIWSGFFWSGPWSGYFGPDFFGPVRVRIFGPDNPYRSGFFCGPVRILVRIFENKIIRIGPNLVRNVSVRSGFSEKSEVLQDKNCLRKMINNTYINHIIYSI